MLGAAFRVDLHRGWHSEALNEASGTLTERPDPVYHGLGSVANETGHTLSRVCTTSGREARCPTDGERAAFARWVLLAVSCCWDEPWVG